MKRRFMLFSFSALAVIVGLLLFINTGQAYTIPNAYFTNGLTGWSLEQYWPGTALVITNGAPNGANSVQVTIDTGGPSANLTSSNFSMEAGETISGWFKNSTNSKYLNVTLYKNGIYQSHDYNISSNIWEEWSLTAASTAGNYKLQFSTGSAVSGQFAIAPVPIPPTVWLLGAGLIGLAGLRRKIFRK